ncbi:MAG: B12-binding domain-containing radical SAM protein [Phycisphaerae bacterium]|nr:B12-binding domain-containing radical SAM protein [Saprospiraceae bacterium]
MHILLSHGYFLCDDPKEQVIMKPYPPLGLLYLSAWLDMHGVENEIFDTAFSTKETFRQRLMESQPRILALYVNLMTKLNVLEIARFVRSQETLKNTLIVFGGPDVTHNVEDYLRHGADLIVIGEGEHTMLEIALTANASHFTRTQSGDAFAHIPGLAFLQSDGSVFKTTSREKIRDLDTLPFPNRLKINLQLYLDAWKKAHGHSAVSVSTQRGCPYTCRWCSTAVYGQSYRRRSPENVVDEIVWLQKNYDFDLIWFVDDVFTISHKWLNEFRDALRNRALKVQFECITRADRLNEEVLSVLKEAGCFRVWIGAESGSQRVIDAMDRRVDVGQVREMIRSARHTGIEAGTFIMLGYPGETEADIRETVRHLKDANPDLFTITVAYPIKGTGLYEEVQASSPDYSGSALPWEQRTDRELDFRRTYPRRYYDFSVRWTVNSVLLHKATLAGKALTFKSMKLLGKVGAARVGMWVSRF